MKKHVALSMLLLSSALAAQTVNKSVQFTLSDGTPAQAGAEYVSEMVVPERLTIDARQLTRVPSWRAGDPIVEIPRGFFGDTDRPAPTPVNPVNRGVDPLALLQQSHLTGRSPEAFNTPLINRDGQGNTGVSPPDPSGDVGRDHYIQAINGSGGALYTIYNKGNGTVAAGPFSMEGLGTGVCANALGDPIVMYDELADRWVLTEFSSTAGLALCMYVSTTDNPISTTWNRYTFVMPSFPDYPKYGVWPDAYYVASNESGGPRPLYAMDRAKMLSGQPATFQRLTTPRLAGFGFEVILPADITGSDAPPSGAPGIFMRHRDDEVHNPGSNNPTSDFLDMYSLKVDFNTPANTVLTGPSSIAINEFSSDLAGLSTFSVFPQPNGQRIDAVREVIMHRLGYRRFSTHESLIANFVTDVDAADTGGIRWVELRRTGGITQAWTKYQEGTYALADERGPADRWMGGIAMDSAGNLAMAYSITRQSPAIAPGLRFTGRLASDPLGVMTAGETELVAGGGSQAGSNRWGDYHDMSVDPVDGCTFWFTGVYVPSASWSTRIASLKHDACGQPTFTLNAQIADQAVCASNPSNPLPPIALELGVVSGYSGDADLGFANPLPAGITGVFSPSTVFLPGSASLQMNVANSTAPGNKALTIRATSGRIGRELPLRLFVASAIAPVATLNAPANSATDVALRPVFSWTASAQAQSYVVEGSLSPSFATLLFTGTVAGGGNSFQPTVALPANAQIYWRMRGVNPCGSSSNSAVFSFTTVPGPGVCPGGQATRVLFSDSVEGTASSWTPFTTTGTIPWAVSTARANSPTRSWKGSTPGSTSNQSVDLPLTPVPSIARAAWLRFFHWRQMEPNAATGCYDGGSLFASINGAQFAAVPTLQIVQNGATLRPLGSGVPAWCGAAPWEEVIVDATPYIGQDVRFRFRVTSDVSLSQEGWYIDDVRVQACLDDLIFVNRFEN